MATTPYTYDYPLGTTTPPNVDDDMRRDRKDHGERLLQGGHKLSNVTIPAATATENNDGKHCVGVETQTDQNDQGFFTNVWDNAGTTALLRTHGTSHATKPGWIEAQAGTKFMGPNVSSGLDPGHLHTQGGVIGGRAGLIGATGYLKPSAFRWSKGTGEGTQTITRLDARLATPPSGGTLVLEVRRTSGAPSNVVDIYNDGTASQLIGTITIANGEYAANQTTLTNNTLNDGEYIVVKCTTLNGSPADLVVSAVITG